MPITVNKRVFRVILLLIFILIAYILFISIEHSRLAKIVINVAPEDSIIKIDGEIVHDRSFYTKPGVHTLVASRPSFKDDSTTVTAEKSKTISIYLLPAPASANALQFLKDNPKIQAEREGIASQKVADTQAALTAKYPIIKYLPLATRYYTIDYGVSLEHPNDSRSLAIYISSDPSNRDLALGWIKYKGFDPAKLEIVYKNP